MHKIETPGSLPAPASKRPLTRVQHALHLGNATLVHSAAAAVCESLRHQQPSVLQLNQLLKALGDNGHLEPMSMVFDAMLGAGVQPTQVTYGTVISRAGRGGKPELASRFYRDMRKRGLQPDVQTLNSLINAYAKAGDVTKAYAAAEVMKKLGVAPTLITYNTLLDACARNGNVSLARTTLEDLRSAKLRPNARTFSILIHMSARASRVDEAFAWFRRMAEAGAVPTDITFTTLINACGRAGQLERAFAVLAEMRLVGLQPNVVTYTTLIDACAKKGQLPRALAIFRDMLDAGVQPNKITCMCLFHGCLTAGEVLLAREVVQHMQTVGLKPSAHAFTSLLSATSNLDASRQHSAAVACLLRQLAVDRVSDDEHSEEAEDAVIGGPAAGSVPPVKGTAVTARQSADDDDWTLEEALAPLADEARAKLMSPADRFQRSLGLLDVLISARLPAPTPLWCALFDDVTTAKELHAALKRHERARLASLAPEDDASGFPGKALLEATRRMGDHGAHTASGGTSSTSRRRGSSSGSRRRLSGHSSSHESARSEAPRGGGDSEALQEQPPLPGSLEPMPPSPQTIQPFLANADTRVPAALEPVFAVFSEMRASGISPDLAAFNVLIDACASVGDLARAEGAFGELCAAGIKPDVITYTCLIKACAVSEDLDASQAADGAEQIYLEMQQKSNHFSTFIPPSVYTYKHLMAVHAHAGRPHRVLELFDEMQERGLKPTQTHYLIALGACSSHPHLPLSINRAVDIYRAMRERGGYRLDTRTLHELVEMFTMHGREDLASRVRSERSMVP